VLALILSKTLVLAAINDHAKEKYNLKVVVTVAHFNKRKKRKFSIKIAKKRLKK
jgi:hypothetical protein